MSKYILLYNDLYTFPVSMEINYINSLEMLSPTETSQIPSFRSFFFSWKVHEILLKCNYARIFNKSVAFWISRNFKSNTASFFKNNCSIDFCQIFSKLAITLMFDNNWKKLSACILVIMETLKFMWFITLFFCGQSKKG